MSFLMAVQVLFIGLKLTGNMSWSWLWVLSPILLQLTIAVVLFLAAVIFLGRR